MRLNQELDLAHAHNAVKILLDLRKLLQIIDLRKGDYTAQITTIIDATEKHLATTPQSDELDVWQLAIIGLRILRSHLHCRDIAQGKPGDILSERERLAVLCDEFQTSLSSVINVNRADSQAINQIVRQDGRSVNAEQLLLFLRSLPLPTTYLKLQGTSFPSSLGNSSVEDEDAMPTSPLVRVIAFIDDVPLVSPQLLQPQLIYSLKFKVRGIAWHRNSQRLHLDLLTTCPGSDYSVSQFILSNPANIKEHEYEGELEGNIRFQSAQSFLSESISFAVRCAFELSDGSFREVPVIGYNQLQFRVVAPGSQGFVSGYRRLDRHVAELVDNLLESSPEIRDELPELVPVLESLTCLLGTYAQGAVFKQTTSVSEAEFQAKVLQDLRLRLGQDVEEHPSQAGGNTDIRYRGIIIELKVEKSNGNREHICQRYTKQSTQYEGVEARQTSIALVLDLTPKKSPPGDIRNDILLVDVRTHGGDDISKKYPSKAFVFIVNGNIKNPSDYSKK